MAVNKGAIIIYEHKKTFPELDNQRRYWGEAVNGGAVLYWGGTTVNTVGHTEILTRGPDTLGSSGA